MSYKCEKCGRKVAPRQPLRRHVVRRPDGTTLREVPVCEECETKLASRKPLERLQHRVEI